jgi:hypothetical protein
MLGSCGGCVLFMVLLFYLFFLCVLVFSVLYYCGATFALRRMKLLNFGGAA